MNDTPKGTVFPKQQLEIVNYEADIPYGQGGKTLDRATAKNLSLPQDSPLLDKPLRHTVFNPELKTHLRGQGNGALIIADVEERERPDKPEYGPDRTIVQVYVDGKPISTKKAGGGGGYGKSPEVIRLEHDLDMVLEGVKRCSIEGQTAMERVVEVLTCPTPIPGGDLGIDEPTWNRILGKFWQAVERGLENYLAGAPKAVQPPQAANPGADKNAAEKDAPPAIGAVKHVGDLLTRSAKLEPPITRADFLEALSIKDTDEIKDLEAAWKTAQEISAKRRELPAGSDQAEKAASESSDEAWDKLKRPGA